MKIIVKQEDNLDVVMNRVRSLLEKGLKTGDAAIVLTRPEEITEKQFSALHVYCRNVAQELRRLDYDFRESEIEVQPSEELVKKHMWKAVQKTLFGSDSTKKLTRQQTQEIYETLNRFLIERFGIHVPWPRKKDK